MSFRAALQSRQPLGRCFKTGGTGDSPALKLVAPEDGRTPLNTQVTESPTATWTQIAALTNLTGTVAWTDMGPLVNQRFYHARVLNP